MAVTTAELAGSITDVVGDLEPKYLARLVLTIEANTPGSLLLDTVGNRVMAGAKRVTIDTTSGAYTVTLVKTDSADIEPATGRLYRATLVYPSGVPGAGNQRQTSGWFEITADTSLDAVWTGLDVIAVTEALCASISDSVAAVEADRVAVAADRTAVEGVVATTEGLMTSVLGSGGTFDAELAATYASKGGDANSLTPLYIDMIDTGLCTNSPANLRTGLASTQYADGGYIAELTIAVTGTAGSATLTTAETTKTAGLGTVPFEAVLNSSDGTDDFFVTVMTHNGSTTITLREPLDNDFTGTLSAKYDAALGQHLTAAGTRAYAQHVARFSGVAASRGGVLEGTFYSRPPTYNTVWAANTALAAYGVSNSAAPVVQSGFLVQPGALNIMSAADSIPILPLSEICGVRAGIHTTGHGITGTIYLGARDVVLEFYTGLYRSGTAMAGALLDVTVTVDDVVVYDETHDHALKQVRLPLHRAGKVVIEIAAASAFIGYLYASQLIIREAGKAGQVAAPTQKVVVMGDSYFKFYDDLFGDVLAEKTGAQVVSHALGGQTTEWALAWFDDYITAERPDVAVFHFFTNDSNDLSADTFVAPDGSNQPKWPAGLTTDQAKAHWRANIRELIRRCQELGIKPVIISPGGTAASSQTDRHMKWRVYLDQGTPTDWKAASTTELADSTAYVNTVGKFTGKNVMVGTSRKTATGPLAADSWGNTTDDSLLPLQKLTLHKSSFTVSTGLAIGTDSNADGLSDGFTSATYSGFADTVTESIVSGRQRLSYAYGTGSGNKRYGVTFNVTAAKAYLVVCKVVNGPASDNLDTVSDIDGTAAIVAGTVDTLDASGAGVITLRETASTTTSRYFRTAPARVNSTTKALDIEALYVIDLALLFASAPNWQSMTDAEIASNFLALPA